MVQTPALGELGDTLAAALADELPAPVEVDGLERLTGGASRETWSFDAIDATGARHDLILRRDFPERSEESDDPAGGLDRLGELALQQVLYSAGVPVARPLGAPPAELGLRECFLMERVEGESRPRAIARKPEFGPIRERLAADTGRALAAIHAIDPKALPRLPESSQRNSSCSCAACSTRAPPRARRSSWPCAGVASASPKRALSRG